MTTTYTNKRGKRDKGKEEGTCQNCFDVKERKKEEGQA
jgi:hypothetical protein